MRKVLLTCFLSLTITFLFAQSDTTKVEQYCKLVAQSRVFSNKVTIDVDYGEERKAFSFKDNRVKDEVTGNAKKFNSVSDALNYMGMQGWILVNAFPISETGGAKVYHFYFKKLFDKKEVFKAYEENKAKREKEQKEDSEESKPKEE